MSRFRLPDPPPELRAQVLARARRAEALAFWRPVAVAAAALLLAWCGFFLVRPATPAPRRSLETVAGVPEGVPRLAVGRLARPRVALAHRMEVFQ